MDSKTLRERSLGITSRAGLKVAPSLPLLDADELILRHADDAVSRLFCIHGAAAGSCGFDRNRVLSWIRREKVEPFLTAAEDHFLETGRGQQQDIMVQVEGAWALAWALNFVSDLDFWADCNDEFVAVLPNLKIDQSGDELLRRAHFRQKEEIIAACDLAYCLHWAIRQAEIDRKPSPAGLKPYVVIERRRALEWLLGDNAWDDVSLDT